PDLHEGFIPREALTTRAAQKAQPEPGRAAPEAPAGERNPDAPSLPAQQQCLVAALDYAVNRSWDVFPVPPGQKKSYKSAKHTAGANGERRATRSRSEKILPNGRTPMSGSRRAGTADSGSSRPTHRRATTLTARRRCERWKKNTDRCRRR